MKVFSSLLDISSLIPHFLFIKSGRGGEQERQRVVCVIFYYSSSTLTLSLIPILQESVGLLHFTKPASQLAAKEEGKGKGKERWSVLKPQKNKRLWGVKAGLNMKEKKTD